MLPFLVPRLLTPPVTAFNIRALASVAEVAGSSLNQHLSSLIPALMEAILNSKDDNISEIREAATKIILAVQEDGLHLLFSELIKLLKDDETNIRIQAAELIQSFCSNTKSSYESEVPDLLEALLNRFNDPAQTVQSAAWGALNAVISGLRKDSQSNYIPVIRRTLESLKEDLQKSNQQLLPGFCLPKGLQPVLPVFLNGLITGSAETREQAAAGLGQLITLTSDEALKPFVIQITGKTGLLNSEKQQGHLSELLEIDLHGKLKPLFCKLCTS